LKIKSWHVGKIVMLWAWSGVLTFVGLRLLQDGRAFLTEHVLIGFGLLFVLGFVPIALSVVTWKWFTGKETGTNKPPVPSKQSESRD
jgi:hypothetical protein